MRAVSRRSAILLWNTTRITSRSERSSGIVQLITNIRQSLHPRQSGHSSAAAQHRPIRFGPSSLDSKRLERIEFALSAAGQPQQRGSATRRMQHRRIRLGSGRAGSKIAAAACGRPCALSSPKMTTVPVIKCTSNERPPGTKSTAYEKHRERLEKKLTVLESHGYTLGKTIGAGSYATVKIAKSDRYNCQVAVKIVSKFQAPGEYLTKFLPREIEVVKGLKHPNLIRFLQAIETTHRVYIVMEYAQNGSLLDVIRHDTYIDEPRGRRWFRQLLEAIDYCHERGIVHRDIKCENLLMDYRFNIKLSDFGFARGQMVPKDGEWPLSTTYCGSYAYASPEILRGIPYQPQLSDVWSMGVVLFAMIYGHLPFDDTNHTKLLKQVQSKVAFPKYPKVSQLCRSLIARILVPQSARLHISNIRTDTWLGTSVVAQTSINGRFINIVSAEPAPKECKTSKALVAPEIFQDILNKKAENANITEDNAKVEKINSNSQS